ncbi:peptidoglycan editing factor PgeF [Marinobacterium arenosum]|uniref:peptidoglycan editing factor PgeF n=1 Tax=Marinobacterium arenosum TaxID=2862496 RepID=UPI001C961112|nr:peptidoglycan editing factor PgeF [Marinobacterium arenosum]MBY4675530.1 peptidoglycan editing factor PgeF [Marinobacterium arenosum]
MKLIQADWPAPAHIKAVTSTRQGGVSLAPYDSLNLGDHVGDNPAHVADNRHRLVSTLGLTQSPQWLEQVHGIDLVEARADGQLRSADACWSERAGQACVVMTADCLPVFFTDKQGSKVAVAHAGWRGLCDGVLENTLAVFAEPAEVLVWLGPAIGPDAFEVGDEVRQKFCDRQASADAAFRPVVDESGQPDKWLADLYLLARLRLQRAGVRSIHGGGFCTYHDSARFFSYRRDGQTGRMASLIWIES